MRSLAFRSETIPGNLVAMSVVLTINYGNSTGRNDGRVVTIPAALIVTRHWRIAG